VSGVVRIATYEARSGLQGLVDRVVLPSAVRRLLRKTLDALDVALEPVVAGVRPR
jgi:hypothetical protein